MSIESIKERVTRTPHYVQSPTGNTITVIEVEEVKYLRHNFRGREGEEFTKTSIRWETPTHWSEVATVNIDSNMPERTSVSMGSGGISKEANYADAYAVKGFIANRVAQILAESERATEEV